MIIQLMPAMAFADTVKKIPTDEKYFELGEGNSEEIAGVTREAKDLTEIIVPDYVKGTKIKSIGDSAFHQCTKVKYMELPEAVTHIGDFAFDHCESMETIHIPGAVTGFGVAAFNECKSLKEITIPDTVTVIDDRAFYGCTSLKEISIPAGVTRIGDGAGDGNFGAFAECSSLENLYVDPANTNV